MSELKNDPHGRKQIAVAFGLTAIAWAILAVSVNGARLSCPTDSGRCVLQRRTLFESSADTFDWGAVRQVSMEYSATRWTASGGGARVIVQDNIILHLDRKIPVLVKPGAWLFGTLGETSLRTSIGRSPPGNLWIASFGLTPWFLWFVAAASGALFALLSTIRKIESDMSADALRAARLHNLSRLAAISGIFALFWSASIFLMITVY